MPFQTHDHGPQAFEPGPLTVVQILESLRHKKITLKTFAISRRKQPYFVGKCAKVTTCKRYVEGIHLPFCVSFYSLRNLPCHSWICLLSYHHGYLP